MMLAISYERHERISAKEKAENYHNYLLETCIWKKMKKNYGMFYYFLSEDETLQCGFFCFVLLYFDYS